MPQRQAAAFFTPLTKLPVLCKKEQFSRFCPCAPHLYPLRRATAWPASYFAPLTKLSFAVAAILGLVGGVRVYSKFSSGDPDASKSATALFLSCVFLVIVGTVLRSFFL